MKQTLNNYEIANLLMKDEYAKWSYEGAIALAEYLEKMEEETGQEMEFDRVAIRCDFQEYETLKDFKQEYEYAAGKALYKKKVSGKEFLEWVEEKTLVIKLKNGHYLIRQF